MRRRATVAILAADGTEPKLPGLHRFVAWDATPPIPAGSISDARIEPTSPPGPGALPEKATFMPAASESRSAAESTPAPRGGS